MYIRHEGQIRDPRITVPILYRPSYPAETVTFFPAEMRISKSSAGRLRDLFSYYFILPDVILAPHWPQNATGRDKYTTDSRIELGTI